MEIIKRKKPKYKLKPITSQICGPVKIWIKEKWLVEDGEEKWRTKYVAYVKLNHVEITIEERYFTDLIHKLGHVLLAITDEHHHPL